MKSSELRRKTPLKSKTALRRTTALNRSPLARSALHAESAKQANLPTRTVASKPKIPARIRTALHIRSGGLCEIATVGCTFCATEDSHRIKLGMGGRKGDARRGHDVLSNLLHACHNCHQIRGHRSPTAAYDAGWMLREHQNPLTEPVLRRGVWTLLDDLGTFSPIDRKEY